MKKKFGLVLTWMLILTFLVTTPNFTPSATTAPPPPEGIYHWKIELAQKKCNAFILGYLTDTLNASIPGTEFELWCNCTGPVFWKVASNVTPTGIYFWKYIDWDKNGTYEYVEPVFGWLKEPEEGHCWYHHQQHYYLELIPLDPPWIDLTYPICTIMEESSPVPGRFYHLSSWEDTGWPYGNLSYCDQVDLTPIEPPGPVDWWHVEIAAPDYLLLDKTVVVEVHQTEISHQWQLTLKQHNCNVIWDGVLTEFGIPIIPFHIVCNCTTLQCQVVRTPDCTLVTDIEFSIEIYSKDGPPLLIDTQIHSMVITQFPWTMVKTGIDPYTGDEWVVELELTEVQMHRYILMGGETISSGQLGEFLPWYEDEPYPLPFATHEPYLTPMLMSQNITFTQVDPITGVVKIWVPAESYEGLDHTYYSPRVLAYVRVRIFLEEAGCGVIFTGQGKEPIQGCVDYRLFNNNTGVYTFGPDQTAKTADDELLAGDLPNVDDPWPPGPPRHAAGAGPPLGPCLQELRGPDGIIGTGDDPIGRGDPDGPNPWGSSILFLPTTLETTWFDPNEGEWKLLYRCPWPQLLTTGTAYDKVIEPMSQIDGEEAQRTGEPWEFFAGIDHPSWDVVWKHDKCNAYVTYACVWSVMDFDTDVGLLDVHFKVVEKEVREDCVIADIDCNEVVDIVDIVICALTYEKQDEDFLIPEATPGYDPRGDVADPRGYVDIVDIVRIAIDYDKQLTPNCIIKP